MAFSFLLVYPLLLQDLALIKLLIAKIRKGSNSLNTGDTGSCIVAIYQYVLYYLITFNTLRDMPLWAILFLQKFGRAITLLLLGETVTVCAFGTFSGGLLSMC